MSSKSPIDASHHDTLRKRVGKACDRCRLKKSKCDGMSPCSRCRIDNAICVFGERKKSHDKVYPKGYVEMLEQQQSQLVAGLQETYRRLVGANLWPGALLEEPEGHPLTHDILSVLDIIHTKPGSPSSHFEEDPVRLQQRLVAQGAPFIARRGSMSSDSEHSCHSHKRARSDAEDTPISSPVQKSFRRPSDRDASSASPLQSTSPFSFPLTLPNKARKATKPSPLSLKTEEMRIDVQPAEDDSLMTPWQWQDFTSDALSMEPQFTFPQEDASLIDSWGAIPSGNGHFDPTIMATYPAGLNFNFDPSRELLDLDMSNSIQVVS